MLVEKKSANATNATMIALVGETGRDRGGMDRVLALDPGHHDLVR